MSSGPGSVRQTLRLRAGEPEKSGRSLQLPRDSRSGSFVEFPGSLVESLGSLVDSVGSFATCCCIGCITSLTMLRYPQHKQR